MSLRRILVIISGVVLVIVITVSAALIYATMQRRSATDELSTSMRKLFLAEELEVNLLLYNRLGYLRSISGDEVYGRRQRAIRADIAARLGDAQQMAEPGEQAVLHQVEEKIDEVFRLDTEAETFSMEERFQKTAPVIESTFALLERVVEANIAESNRVGQTIQTANQFVTRLVMGTIALLIFSTVYLVLIVYRGLYRPIRGLEQSIAAFRVGGDANAPERGPEELRRVSETFNQLGNRLQQQRAESLRFISGVAHDLRNPLTALRGYTELLAGSPQALPPERLRDTFAMLNRQVVRMDSMINDFLDASRIEAGSFELHMREVDLREVAKEAVELFSATSAKHVIRAAVPETPLVAECDRARIEQVLNNLISNAIKYSPRGGEVLVSCEASGGWGIFRIRDQGIGISPQDQERIFTPFQRTEATKGKYPGVGLGLSVAKKLVAAHGGEVRIESAVGQGTTFEVRLPLRIPTKP
jgi:signal transduction histidine kinase